MKKLIVVTFTVLILGSIAITIYSLKDILIEMYKTYTAPYKKIKIEKVNEYYRNYNFDFVQVTDHFIPDDQQDIYNIYYTILNSGLNSFTFYCSKEYTNCLDDVKTLANDQNTLSDINNYVHPYNGFAHIETEYDNLGKIIITIEHTYTKEDIEKINQRVDELLQELTSQNYSEYKNIQMIHDYIINHSKYDTQRAETGDSPYRSDTAYGPLFEGMSICGGYTDLMELFLEKMGIKSFKVSSEKHVWNAVYYNYDWLNLDLTWDDPVASDGNDYLEYNYFLIDTKQLLDMEATEHNFEPEHYYELKRFS